MTAAWQALVQDPGYVSGFDSRQVLMREVMEYRDEEALLMESRDVSREILDTALESSRASEVYIAASFLDALGLFDELPGATAVGYCLENYYRAHPAVGTPSWDALHSWIEKLGSRPELENVLISLVRGEWDSCPGMIWTQDAGLARALATEALAWVRGEPPPIPRPVGEER